MKVLTEKQFEKSWSFFWKKVTENELDSYFDEDTLKENLKRSAGALNEDTGIAYPGGLISHINLTLVLAEKFYNILNEEPFNILNIDKKTLEKVLLLMHLSKIEMFEPNDNQWEIEKRGLNFKFAQLEGKLKFGERSILDATQRGIFLTAEEFEAMRSIDKKGEDTGSDFYSSTLSTIVRQVNEIAYIFEKERNKQ